MKTRIATLIAMTAIVFGTANLTYAATKTGNTKNEVTVLAEITNINKIEASGNVEVYVTSGEKDQVKVYDNYYAQNALVQDKDGVLRISSYNTDKLVVLVTVTDLREITANDNAAIKSLGRFSALELNVNLNDNAAAQLKMNTYTANINVNDCAKADLAGDVNNYTLNYSRSSSVNRTELTAANRTETITNKGLKHHIHADRMVSL
jgi:hypothetical protein